MLVIPQELTGPSVRHDDLAVVQLLDASNLIENLFGSGPTTSRSKGMTRLQTPWSGFLPSRPVILDNPYSRAVQHCHGCLGRRAGGDR